jgi:serine/threonine protein kinase
VYRGWEIGDCLGAGGSGEVFQVYDPVMEASHALKCISAKHLDARGLARAKAEARVLGRLRHPNLVHVTAAGMDDEKQMFWMLMELLDGFTLRTTLSGGRLPILRAIQVAIDAADGMSHLHENGVIHRDLKPENILLTHNRQVKVLDLGTAKFYGVGLNTSGRMIMGTFAYMSPEQMQGKPVDPRSDVYSLGLVLYEMLAGFHPFVPDGQLPDAQELCRRQLLDKPPPLPEACEDCPVRLWNVVAKMLAKNPADRYRSMLEASRDLRANKQEIADLAKRAGHVPLAGVQTDPSSRREYLEPQVPPRSDPAPARSGERVITEAVPHFQVEAGPAILTALATPAEAGRGGFQTRPYEGADAVAAAPDSSVQTTAPSTPRSDAAPTAEGGDDQTQRSESSASEQSQPPAKPLGRAIFIAGLIAAATLICGASIEWVRHRWPQDETAGQTPEPAAAMTDEPHTALSVPPAAWSAAPVQPAVASASAEPAVRPVASTVASTPASAARRPAGKPPAPKAKPRKDPRFIDDIF